MKNLTLSFILFLTNLCIHAQGYYLSGVVTDVKGETLPGVNVTVKGTTTGTATDFNGYFQIKISGGTKTLVFTGIGFKPQELQVDRTLRAKQLSIRLKDHATELNAVQVVAKSESFRIEQKGFNVDAIQTKKIQAQSLELNKVLGRTAGVRVRQSGGMGSDFNYSLDGMSGNAIRFFIDGIPMDYYGSSYSINNIPIVLIDRIDIYKGVVPVDLGSDALGGAINLVTNQHINSYAAATYSFGSFNTHQAALHGQWRSTSGFTTRLSGFYRHSDNNYKVWGRGVIYGEEGTGRVIEFTKDDPATRFNDDFKTFSTKVDIGFTQQKWADQFFVSLLASDLKKGIQTGRTMSHVYGEMRNNEEVFMPSMSYQKKNLFTHGLNVNAFAAYSHTKNVLVDTTMNSYDWRGQVIGSNPSGGERGRGSRSLYTQKDKSEIYRINVTYLMPFDFKLGFNYLHSSTKRTGEDPFAPTYRIPYIEPQNVGSNFAGLSLETTRFNDKLHANAFVKYYGFNSSINELVYTTEYETVVHSNKVSNWGGGLATSYRIFPKLLLKSSIEQASRLPTATEALGDGANIQNNPSIKPEQSFNANLGTVLGRYKLGSFHGIKVALNTFYRNTTDRLQLNVEGGQELGEYINIRAVGGTGSEIDIVYDYDQQLKVNLNATYLNIRNTQKKDEHGNENQILGDRLRNMPYFLANAGIQYTTMDFIQRHSKLFTYIQSGYVHEFFLGWPSLGSRDGKNTIPTQLVCDAGIGYTFPSDNLTLAVDVSNIFSEQVYDNFLLQKPGRAIFLKINYQIKL